MSLFAKAFLVFGGFLAVVSAIYAYHAQEYEGLVLSISVTLAALLLGWSVTWITGKTRSQLLVEPAKPGYAADDEPHVKPTIWPFVFALSAIGLVIGMIGNRWALIPGGALFVAAAVGWIVDVHRQWRHHQAHAESHSPDSHHAEIPAG